MNSYTTFCEWNYVGEDSFEHCYLRPSTPEDIDYDGYNMIGGAGREGFDLTVHNSLEDALLKCNYNPAAINYCDLSDEDFNKVLDILSDYSWTYEGGLVRNEQGIKSLWNINKNK